MDPYSQAKIRLLNGASKRLDRSVLVPPQHCVLGHTTEENIFLRIDKPSEAIPLPPIQMCVKGLVEDCRGELRAIPLLMDDDREDRFFPCNLLEDDIQLFLNDETWTRVCTAEGVVQSIDIAIPEHTVMEAFTGDLDRNDREAIADALVQSRRRVINSVQASMRRYEDIVGRSSPFMSPKEQEEKNLLLVLLERQYRWLLDPMPQ